MLHSVEMVVRSVYIFMSTSVVWLAIKVATIILA